jgi:hypothetical protein
MTRTLVETEELLNIREYMNGEGQDYIANMISRREDELEYEPWKDYAEAFKKTFSKFGETQVLEKNQKNPKRGKYQFLIYVKLNDFQTYYIEIKKYNIRWSAYQDDKKIPAGV